MVLSNKKKMTQTKPSFLFSKVQKNGFLVLTWITIIWLFLHTSIIFLLPPFSSHHCKSIYHKPYPIYIVYNITCKTFVFFSHPTNHLEASSPHNQHPLPKTFFTQYIKSTKTINDLPPSLFTIHQQYAPLHRSTTTFISTTYTTLFTTNQQPIKTTIKPPTSIHLLTYFSFLDFHNIHSILSYLT